MLVGQNPSTPVNTQLKPLKRQLNGMAFSTPKSYQSHISLTESHGYTHVFTHQKARPTCDWHDLSDPACQAAVLKTFPSLFFHHRRPKEKRRTKTLGFVGLDPLWWSLLCFFFFSKCQEGRWSPCRSLRRNGRASSGRLGWPRSNGEAAKNSVAWGYI